MSSESGPSPTVGKKRTYSKRSDQSKSVKSHHTEKEKAASEGEFGANKRKKVAELPIPEKGAQSSPIEVRNSQLGPAKVQGNNIEFDIEDDYSRRENSTFPESQ